MVVMRPFLRTSLLAALATCAAISVAGQTAPPAPLRLVAANSTRTIPTVMSGDTELVAFDDLAALFGLTVREDTVARAITVTYKGKTIVLSQNQALASISGRLVSLPAPPVKIGARWYVPVEFIGRALSLISDVPLELRKASRLVLQGAVRAPRVVVRHDVGGNQARVTVDVTPRTPHQVQQDGARATVRFDADLIDLHDRAVPVPGHRPGDSCRRGCEDRRDRSRTAFRIAPRRGLAARSRRDANDDRSLRGARSDRGAAGHRGSRRCPRCRSRCFPRLA